MSIKQRLLRLDRLTGSTSTKPPIIELTHGQRVAKLASIVATLHGDDEAANARLTVVLGKMGLSDLLMQMVADNG